MKTVLQPARLDHAPRATPTVIARKRHAWSSSAGMIGWNGEAAVRER